MNLLNFEDFVILFFKQMLFNDVLSTAAELCYPLFVLIWNLLSHHKAVAKYGSECISI